MTDSSTDKNQTITYDYITKNDFGVVMSHLKACFYKVSIKQSRSSLYNLI